MKACPSCAENIQDAAGRSQTQPRGRLKMEIPADAVIWPEPRKVPLTQLNPLMKRFAFLILGLALVEPSCGGNDTPTSPSTSSTAQIGGVWTGSTTLTAVNGGECVGALLQPAIGSVDQVTIAVTQNGGSATATVTSQGSGTSCSYVGTVGSSTFAFNATSCQVSSILGITCTNGAMRDMVLVADSFTGNVSGNTSNGTAASTWNVRVAGTATGVGILTSNSTFSVNR